MVIKQPTLAETRLHVGLCGSDKCLERTKGTYCQRTDNFISGDARFVDYKEKKNDRGWMTCKNCLPSKQLS